MIGEPFWAEFPKTLFGVGAVGNVGTLAKTLGGKRVLIITDQGIFHTGLVDKVRKPLEAEGITVGIFDRCEPDAPISNVKSCAQLAKEGSYDLLVGLGGGSSMDITKVVSIAVTAKEVTNESISQYIPMNVPGRGLPKILIPTTSGTGSEVSVAAVVTDVDGCKKPIISDYLFADAAIVDPIMTLNLPAKITADSGMDALSHALEAFTGMKANLISDDFAEVTVKMIGKNIRDAYSKGAQNIEARYNMAIAASYGSLALTTCGGGAILNHGVGHSLQSIGVHSTHGVCCSVMLPCIMEYNMITNQAKYGRIAQLMGEKIEGLSPRDAAKKGVDAVRQLALDLSMPLRLRDIGVKKDDISKLVEILFKFSTPQIANNPRDCSREDAARLFEMAW